MVSGVPTASLPLFLTISFSSGDAPTARAAHTGLRMIIMVVASTIIPSSITVPHILNFLFVGIGAFHKTATFPLGEFRGSLRYLGKNREEGCKVCPMRAFNLSED